MWQMFLLINKKKKPQLSLNNYNLEHLPPPKKKINKINKNK